MIRKPVVAADAPLAIAEGRTSGTTASITVAMPMVSFAALLFGAGEGLSVSGRSTLDAGALRDGVGKQGRRMGSGGERRRTPQVSFEAVDLDVGVIRRLGRLHVLLRLGDGVFFHRVVDRGEVVQGRVNGLEQLALHVVIRVLRGQARSHSILLWE
ncbi:hypothetical protein J4G37_01830 [Microvirga sp. 3-52]|nr:hypothetical protein [Microvirga sp. 3-52]